MASPAPSPRHVLFTCKFEGNNVGLKGSWDGWKLDTPMQKQDDGTWSISLPLLPGVYEYKFLVDGKYREDPNQLTIGSYHNHGLQVMPSIRIKLHGLRNKRGPPFAFQVDPMASMQTILTHAKAACTLPEDMKLVFALKDGTILRLVEDFREDDHVYLDPTYEDDEIGSLQSDVAQLGLEPDQVRLVCTNDASALPQIFKTAQEAVAFVIESNKRNDGKMYRLERAKPSKIQINSVSTLRNANLRQFIPAVIRGSIVRNLSSDVHMTLQMDTAADLSVLYLTEAIFLVSCLCSRMSTQKLPLEMARLPITGQGVKKETFFTVPKSALD